ncbi:hypothetical protein EON67_02275 [archaeon]|nr:MAG: hypothetical protein EON67_02275 [archaeon]
MGACSSQPTDASAASTMGASSSLPLEPFASAVVSPASGEVGAIRRATRYKDELKASCYPGEVATCYDVFQYVRPRACDIRTITTLHARKAGWGMRVLLNGTA